MVEEDYSTRLFREMQEYQARQKAENERREAEAARLQEMVQAADQACQRYDNFKEQMSNACDEAAKAAAMGMKGTGLTTEEAAALTHAPVQVQTGMEAAAYLKDSKHILILTGAGLSAACGIPTFRGAGGFWTKQYAGVDDPTTILTRQFFLEHPEAFWDWHFDFDDILEGKAPSAGHHAIQDYLQWTQQRPDHSSLLVTQNIDDLHTLAMPEPGRRAGKVEGTSDFAFTDHVIELHGNVRYMRCIDFCGQKWFTAPSKAECQRAGSLPKCEVCGKIMKPHSMCFDESYSEQFYQSETVYRYLQEKCDGLIVIGTALQTSYACSIVSALTRKDTVPMVEVNLEANLKQGFSINLLKPSDECLPELFAELVKLKA